MIRNDMKEKIWEKGRIQRYLSLFLIAVLVTTQCTQSMGVPLVTAQTSCSAHEIHDETCGYIASVEGHACNHVCDENCVTQVENCVHVHDESCGYIVAVEGQLCTHSHNEICGYKEVVSGSLCTHVHDEICGYTEASEDDVCEHQHSETCGYVEATEEEPCTHAHDTECGYAEAKEASACAHQHTEECYKMVEDCQHVHSVECEYVDAVEGAECIHTCPECNPAGELSLTEAVFNKNPESDDYKDIVISFYKGADILVGIEREIGAEEITENEGGAELQQENTVEKSREEIEYELVEDEETVIVTLKKEVLEKLEAGEHALYFIMQSGVEKCFALTITNVQQVEVEAFVEMPLNTVELDEGAIAINEENFPDENFRNFLKTTVAVNPNQDEKLTKEELDSITTIDLCGAVYSNSNVADEHACKHTSKNLKGIENFKNLVYLYCGNGELTELDVSKNSALQFLNCRYNNLTELDVSCNTELTYLNARKNNLTEIDLSNNPKMIMLGVNENKLTELDVSNMTNITTLYAANNNLTEIDVSKLTELTYLDCRNNYLTRLDVGNNKKLTVLECYHNDIEELNLENNPKLKRLYCSYNRLKKLDVSNKTALEDLRCHANQLRELKVNGCTKLSFFRLYSNHLTYVDIAASSLLTSIEGYGQNGANLQLYYDEENAAWISEEGLFAEKTLFYSDSNMETPLGDEYFDVVNGALKQTQPLDCSLIYFKSQLVDGKEGTILSGAFTYTARSDGQLSAETGYMDFSNGVNLSEENDLIKYFQVYDGSTVLDSVENLNVTCETEGDFAKIQEGIMGSYVVNISENDDNGRSCTTRLEVGANIDSTNFPDETFRKIISTKYDTGMKLGFFTAAELETTTEIDITGINTVFFVEDLTGIEFFKNLQTLTCIDGNLGELDLSMLTELITLNCYGTGLTKLDVGGCEKLENLNVSENLLTELDLSSNVALMSVDCSANSITELTLNESTSLEGTTLNAGGQIIGNLPLYYVQDVDDGSDTWVNSAMNETEIVREFNENTIFKDSTNSENILSYLQLNEENKLKAISEPATLPESVYYVSQLDPDNDELILSGTFTITIPDQYYPVTQIDINVAKSLKRANDLLTCFTPTPALLSASTTNTAVCPEFRKVKAGIPGQYSVTLSVNGTTYSTAVEVCIDIDYQDSEGKYLNFPDENFRSFLKTTAAVNPNKDAILTKEELDSITVIDLCGAAYNNPNVVDDHACRHMSTNLKGIENFKNLTYLYCGNGKITELDVSQNIALQFLNCRYNNLTELDVTQNSKLTYLNFRGNSLTEIDLRNNSGLIKLGAGNSKLTELDVSHLTNLEILYCFYSDLEKLELGDTSNLKELYCQSNKLTEIDVSRHTELAIFECFYNQLTELDVSNNNLLETLICSYNKLTKLDVSNKKLLKDFRCHANQLTELKVSGCTSLSFFRLYSNQLTYVDIKDSSLLSSIEGYGQTIATLPLYYNDELGAWTGAEEMFAENTIFYSDSNMEQPLDDEYFDVVDGTLIQTQLSDCSLVYFKSQLVDSKEKTILSGAFTYIVRGEGQLSAENGFMDFGDGDNLQDEDDLIQYFQVYDGSTVVDAVENFTVTCENNKDFEKIREGIIGSYAVTISENGENGRSCITHLEVGVNIDNINFPDDVFRKVISAKYDSGMKIGFFTAAELVSTTEIDITVLNVECWVEDLTGIEFFKNLQTLTCIDGNLGELDLSMLKELTTLNCYGVGLTKLDISGCKKLNSLNVSDNDLTELDLTNNLNLTKIYCYTNHLTKLDISELENLSVFQAHDQTVDTLTMYYDDQNRVWINQPESANSVYTEFNIDTKPSFWEDTSDGTAITDDDLDVNENGQLVAKHSTSDVRTIYFKTELEDANENIWSEKPLSGTFSYAIPDIAVTNGYIDKHKARDLTEATLFTVNGFTVTTGNQTGDIVEISSENMEIALKNPEDLSNIRGQIMGQYPVIITYNDVIYDVALEVGLEIDYYAASTDKYVNFPDEKFREYLSSTKAIHRRLDNFLTADEISNVKEIDVTSKGCGSLDGIGYFINLETLKCTDNNLTELNVNSNSKLSTLNCSVNKLTELNLDNHTALVYLACDSNLLKSLNLSGLTSLKELSCDGNQLTSLNLSGLTSLENVQAYDQIIEEQYMAYREKRWLNVESPENGEVRTFLEKADSVFQEISVDTGVLGKKLDFYVEDGGMLAARSLFPTVRMVYFASDLVLENGSTLQGALSGTFTYYPEHALSGSTLFFTSSEITEQLQTLNVTDVAGLKNLNGVISTTPNLEEIKDAVTISLLEGDFEALKSGTKGTYTYQLTLALPSGATSNTGKIVVYGDQDMVVDSLLIIPADIRLTRASGENYATAQSAVELIESTEQESPDVIKIYTNGDLTLETGENKEQLQVSVYNEKDQSPSSTVPLAVLNSENLKGEFELISGDVTKLKGKSYTGTMEFTISYGE